MKECALCLAKPKALGLCAKHYRAAHYQKNKATVRTQSAEWYASHKEQKQRTRAIYYEQHRGKALADSAARYQLHKAEIAARQLLNRDSIRKRMREWAERNKERLAAKRAAWQKANPEQCRAYNAARRAREYGAYGSHTGEQIKHMFAAQRGRCAICRRSIAKSYHKDHILALVNGGSNGIENIQLLCPTCNQKKRDKDNIAFMQELGFLL